MPYTPPNFDQQYSMGSGLRSMLFGEPSTDIRLQGNSYNTGTLMGTGLTEGSVEQLRAINDRINAINIASRNMPAVPGGIPGLEGEPMSKVTPIQAATPTDNPDMFPGPVSTKALTGSATDKSNRTAQGLAMGIGVGTGLFNMANVGAKTTSDGRISSPGMKLSTAGTLGAAGATTGNPFIAAGGFLAGGAIDLVNFFKGQSKYRSQVRAANTADYIAQHKADLGKKDYTGYA